MPVFSGDELRQLIESATWLTVNEYEAEMLCRKTGLTLPELCDSLQRHPLGGVIATLGAQGADIYTKEGTCTRIEAMPVVQAVDPTGCGDAFRAGLLYGLSGGMSLERSVCIATVMGGIKIQSRGGQNHLVTETQVLELVSKHYPSA
jgi:adenosine kinase